MSNINDSDEQELKKMGKKEFCSYLRERLKNQDIDFVASTYSELHSIGIDAFVLDLAQRTNKKPRGIILAPRLPGQSKRITSEKDLACNAYADINLLMFDPSEDQTGSTILRKQDFDRIFRYYRFALGFLYTILRKKGNRRIFFLNAAYYDLSYLGLFSDTAILRKYSPIFVLLEEGAGTYLTNSVWKLAHQEAISLQKGTSLANKIRSDYIILIKKLFDNVMWRFVATEDRLLFRQKDGKLIPNEKSIELYKDAIKCRARFAHSKDHDSAKTALILPPSYPGLFSFEFELSFVRELVELLNRNHIRSMIKPHPTERSSRYNILSRKNSVSILRNEFPVEDILLTTDPICILGETSTALLTANVLYNIPAISFIDILLNLSDDRLLQMTGHQFKKIAEGYVHFVSNTAQLEHLVRSMSR
jgi:hypothetical protein